MLSHLIMFGFIKDYTIWTFHGERGYASVDGSSSGVDGSSSGVGNSSTTTNVGGPAGTVVAGDDDADHHGYIIVADLFGDDAGDRGGDEDVGATLPEPKDVELFENNNDNRLDEDNTLFGNRGG
jgi:hypothetical protein